MSIIRFRRGYKDDLPPSAPSGMPLWCEDTKELYMGTDEGVAQVSGNNDNVVITGTPYCVNSGKQNAQGYADFIHKVSDNQISFDVDDGSVHKPLIVTYPDMTTEESIFIPNLTAGLNDDALYTLIKEKEAADITPVKIGYESQSEESMIPTLSSNNDRGYIVSSSPASSAAYTAFSTGWESSNKSRGMVTIELPEPKVVGRYFLGSAAWETPKTWTFQGSHDGVNWDVLDSRNEPGNPNNWYRLYNNYFNVDNTTAYKFYKINVTGIQKGGGDPNNHVRLKIRYYEYLILPGGEIYEQQVEPANPAAGDYWVNIAVKPYQSYKYNGAEWIEKQFVKLGEVKKLAGLLGTPISYAFNGYYDSGFFSISATQSYVKNNNLGIDWSNKLHTGFVKNNTTGQSPVVFNIWTDSGTTPGTIGIISADKNTVTVKVATNLTNQYFMPNQAKIIIKRSF